MGDYRPTVIDVELGQIMAVAHKLYREDRLSADEMRNAAELLRLSVEAIQAIVQDTREMLR